MLTSDVGKICRELKFKQTIKTKLKIFFLCKRHPFLAPIIDTIRKLLFEYSNKMSIYLYFYINRYILIKKKLIKINNINFNCFPPRNSRDGNENLC